MALLDDVINLLVSTTFWIAIGTLGALAALFLTWWQIRGTRIIAATDFLLKHGDSFSSDRLLKKRHKIMQVVKQDLGDFQKMDECREVFEFFEELGLLLRMKVIGKELVWSNYCYWIQHYWTAFQGYIEWIGKKDSDPTLYCEFEYLYKQIHAYDERKRNQTVEIGPQQVLEFIDDETRLATIK